MIKPKIVISFLAGTVLLSACGGALISPEARAATETTSAIDRIAAQTLESLRTEEAVVLRMNAVPTATHTVLPATRTPVPSVTPLPAPIRITVTVDTNCRTGPGSSFPMVGALMVGESTIVRARVPELDYWIVENPDNPGGECWLWGRHASLVGGTNNLPVATPPWTPTPEPGTIAGWVYLDEDYSWTRDASVDSPISGIELTLRVGNCPGGSTVAIVETDTRGRYQISNLVPTLYCLSRDESLPLNPNTWSLLIRPGQFRDEINFFRLP